MERLEHFTFFASYDDALAFIKNEKARAIALEAIIRYGLYGEEPDLEKMPERSAIALAGILPNLRYNRKRALAGKKGMKKRWDKSNNEPISSV